MQQEDDLRALAKIMDFLRAVSIILVVIHVYWYGYRAIRTWGLGIGVVDRILMNFQRTAGLFSSMLYTKLFAVVLLGLSCLGTKGVKGEKITWEKIYAELGMGGVLFFLNGWLLRLPLCRYDFSGLCLSVDGGAMDEPTIETQPDGRCIQHREREFYAGNAVSGE